MSKRPPPPSEPIDAVLMWVDGDDPAWRADMLRWREACGLPVETVERNNDNGAWRYRDYGTLRHWFRAIHAFAPWFRRVFFVTAGHLPPWLDLDCPKLRVVRHSDFIPAEYLPTFNPRPIALNFHRIPDLSERFVLFDDDTFLLRRAAPSAYFRGGLPVLPASLNVPGYRSDINWVRTIFNDFYEVNTHRNVPQSVRRNWRKWFNPFRLGPRRALSNLVYFTLNRCLPVTAFGHLPLPHLKSTLAEIWRECPAALERTCRSKFRSHDQVNIYLAVAWNLASGRFFPCRAPSPRAVIELAPVSLSRACRAILDRAFPQVCVNDSRGTDDHGKCFAAIREAFDAILPDPSPFENDGGGSR